MDELDTILTLGQVKLIAVEDPVGDILIEVEGPNPRLMQKNQR
jgi:hypothetical protein